MKWKASIWLLLALTTSCMGQSNKSHDTAIDYSFAFDRNTYLGTWYEIARYDHSFERNLQQVTATYSIRPDGKINVLNKGVLPDGKWKEANGKAKIPDLNDPRRLKVSFFWIFYADYFILELDKEYTYAIIGSSSPDYLWILSRTPQLPIETKELILTKIRERGYNADKLIWVKQ